MCGNGYAGDYSTLVKSTSLLQNKGVPESHIVALIPTSLGLPNIAGLSPDSFRVPLVCSLAYRFRAGGNNEQKSVFANVKQSDESPANSDMVFLKRRGIPVGVTLGVGAVIYLVYSVRGR